MSDNGNPKLKIKTVLSEEGEEDFIFSPEEMQPFEVAETLESDLVNGKTMRQYRRARRRFPKNELREEFHLSFRESLKNQIKGLTSVFLVLSSVLMYLFKPENAAYLTVAAVTALITVTNAFFEYRASVALKSPRKYSSLKARVVRGGAEEVTDSRGLVPGDIIILEEGCVIPADCRLIDDMGLSVSETHVSGKDGTTEKSSRYISGGDDGAVCPNMVYAGSIVMAGHGTAIVCYTGPDTLLRRMRAASGDVYVPGLLKYVRSFSRFISAASMILSFFLMVLGVAAGTDVTEMFICAVAIGAASMSDGMLSLCASSLGFGAKRMTRDGTVVRNYGCVETLSRTDTIMCGRNLAFPPKRILLTGLFFSGRSFDREKRPDAQALELLKLLLVCSDVQRVTQAERRQKRGLAEYKGPPLEECIVEYFGEWNESVGAIREQYIRMDSEYTLSGEISRMLTLHNGKNTVIVRGSPENLLSRCCGYSLDGTDYKLSDYTRKKIIAAVEDAARTNSFLIAVACGETEASSLRDLEAEQRLIFKGFISFSSSLDPGVASSVYRCSSAGIETVLNSGDAYYPALNAAKSAGIITDESQIITAEQLRSCDRGLFIANCPNYKLFLNIDDGEWLDVVHLRRESGRVTVVTAERVNELSVMKEADVSVVPEDSCDTLRQTADALLLGSGINLLADAILNAKTICRRIRSVMSYLVAGVTIMLVASVFSVCYNQTMPLRAQDVLFGGMLFNLVFAFALAFAPKSIKTLRENLAPLPKQPKLADFIYPLMFSVGGGITLFVCYAATESYTCTLISLTVTLFLYACTTGDHGGVFKTKRFGSPLLYLCGLGVAAFGAFLILTKPGHLLFGYGVPTPSRLIFTLIASVAYCAVTQIFRYILSPEGKTKKEKNKINSEETS